MPNDSPVCWRSKVGQLGCAEEAFETIELFSFNGFRLLASSSN
jgi:hypothetical protein